MSSPPFLRIGTSSFPQSLDTFPTVLDASASSVSPVNILWAEHHNRLADASVKMQVRWSNALSSETASGLGGIRGLSYGFMVSADLDQLYRAFLLPTVLDPGANPFSGNYIPFEFVLTASSKPFPDIQGFLVRFPGEEQFFQAVAGGLNPLDVYPLCSCQIVSATLPIQDLSRLFASAHVLLGQDSLILRGWVVDLGGSHSSSFNAGLFKAHGVQLAITVVGVGRP